MIKTILIILLLVVAMIPISVEADEFDFTATKIDDENIYSIFDDSNHIEDKRVYVEQELVEWHLPLLITTTDKTIDFNKGQLEKLISHIVQGNIKNKNLTFEYEMLVNETYQYELGVYETIEIPYNFTWHDNETGLNYTEVRYYNQTEMIDTIWIEDWRWTWYNLEDLEEYDGKNKGFICIDIVGKTTATINQWSADIIPTLEINGLRKSYPEFAWWNNNWDYYRNVTIDGTFIEEAQIYFPILLAINETIGDECNGGDSFRAIGTDNVTEYYYEIERNWSADGISYVWINISHLKSGVDNYFLIYYGNGAAADNQQPENVWDSHYTLVYHMNSTSTIINDASEVTWHNATKEGVNDPQETDAQKIGYGQQFVLANTEWAEAADHADFDTQQQTLMFWTKPTTIADMGMINKNQDAVNTNSWTIYTYAAGQFGSYCLRDAVGPCYHRIYHNKTYGAGGSAGFVYKTAVGTAVAGRWAMVTTVWYGFTTGLGGAVDMGMGFGRNGGARDQYSNEVLDEVRLSDNIRNASYINLTYDITNQTSTIISIGSEHTNITPPTVFAFFDYLYPLNNSINVCPCANCISVRVINSHSNKMNLTIMGREQNSSYYHIWDKYIGVVNGTYTFCIDTIKPTIKPHASATIDTGRSAPVAGQWYNITFDEGHGRDIETDLRNATIPSHGHYTISYDVAVQDSGVNPKGDIIAIRMLKDGVELKGSYQEYSFLVSNRDGHLTGFIHDEFFEGENITFQYIVSDDDCRITANGTYSTDNVSMYAYMEKTGMEEHHPLRYNYTYYWYANVTQYGNSLIYNETEIFNFKTAWSFSNCSVNGDGAMSNEAWLVGIVIVFSIFGIIAFIKTRRIKL